MTLLVTEFPEMKNIEILGRNFWTCNSQEMHRNYNPL